MPFDYREARDRCLVDVEGWLKACKEADTPARQDECMRMVVHWAMAWRRLGADMIIQEIKNASVD